MSRSEGNPPKADAYAATLNSITEIPPELMTIFTGPNVVDCLKRQYLSYLNELPFVFSAENDHVWQVLEALEAVLNNNHGSFSKDKEGEELNKDIFGKFVSLANDLKEDEGFAKQMWMVVFLHDIAKYSVQNADHAQISGNLTTDLFKTKDFALAESVQDRITWVIGNHDAVGNIVSSAERAPRYLTEGLEELSGEEKQIRLKMLIVLSLCDLRGTLNGKFVNDYNTESRFWAADFSWLKQKEAKLFLWRKERLVRAFTEEETKEKQEDWDRTFERLREETQEETPPIIEKQFGKNIRVLTNLLYLALHLEGEELVKLFAIISLLVEMVTGGKPNPNFQVHFTKGAGRDKPGPIVDGFKALLKKIKLSDLTLAKITKNYKNNNGQTIYGIPISLNQNSLTIDSKKIGDDWLRNAGKWIILCSMALVLCWLLPWVQSRERSSLGIPQLDTIRRTYGFQLKTGIVDGNFLPGALVPLSAVFCAIAAIFPVRWLRIATALVAGSLALSHGMIPIIRFGGGPRGGVNPAIGAYLSALFGIIMLILVVRSCRNLRTTN